MKRIARIFSKPAPHLIHLELDAAQQLGRTTPFPNIFGLEFPKLRVLKVAGIEGWPEIVGANLTRITINKFLKPQVLKDCLPYSPNLKVLEVQGLWMAGGGILSTSEKIALPPGVRLSIRRTRECPRILTFFALPRDGHVRISPFTISMPNRPLLSYVLPTSIFHLQNLRTMTRLHAKAHYDLAINMELEGFRLDRPVFEVNVRYFFENRTALQKASPIMCFLRDLPQTMLEGVEELQMDGFVGCLEPLEVELRAFLERMPALMRMVTTDVNEKSLRSVLESLGSRALCHTL